MSIYEKYELVDVLGDDGVKTFQAREIATGRTVQIHMLVGQPGKSEPPYELLEQLHAVPARQKAHLVETGEHLGTPYIVTLPLEGFSSFREWVRLKSLPPTEENLKPAREQLTRVGIWKVPQSGEEAPAASGRAPGPSVAREVVTVRQPAAQAPLAPPKPDSAPPDITQMFNTAEVLIPKKLPVGPVPPPAGDDDFDKLFLAPKEADAPAAAPGAAPLFGPPQTAKASEFTQMFQAHSPATGSFVAPEPVKAAEAILAEPAPSSPVPPPADSFTQMFQAPPPAAKVTGEMKAVETPPPVAPLKDKPGEFTLMFRAQQAAGSAPDEVKTQESLPVPATPAKLATTGEFTQMFQAPLAGTAQTKAAGPEALSAPAAEPPLPLGRTGQMKVPEPKAGGFTQMFQAPATPSLTGQMKAEPAGPSTSLPTPEPAKTGEFTQMFQAPAVTPSLTGQMKAEATMAPAPPVTAKAGEFTQMFQAPSVAVNKTGQMKAMESPPVTEGPAITGEAPVRREEPVTPLSATGAMKVPEPKATDAPDELAKLFEPPPAAAPPKTTAPARGAGAPGEFTQMFAASPMQPLGEARMGPPAPGPSAPAQQPFGKPSQGPGEFTRLFSTPIVPKQALPVANPGQTPVSETNPFAPPTSPLVKPMMVPNPAQQASPFGAPSQNPAPYQPQGAAPNAGAIPQRPFGGPSQPSVQDEYQKLFGGGPTATPQAGPPAQGGFFSGATQSFQAMSTPNPQSVQQSGPSEYTRMFQQPVAAPPPQAAQPLAPPPIAVAPKQSPKWPLYAVGGLIIVLLIGLIVTFIRK